MKKLLPFISLLLSIPLLFSCSKDNGEKIGDSVEMKARIDEIGEKITVTVTESEYAFGTYWVITPKETVYLNKDGEGISRSDIAVGDEVVIRYSGQVMMSYPPQIVAAKMQKLK